MLSISKMPSPAKDRQLLELFLNEQTKHWHFNQLVKAAKISEPRALHWLKKWVKEGLIKHVKLEGRLPYFIANYDNPCYKIKKKLYALTCMYETGFLAFLQSLQKAKTVVIFGSFARSDWYTDSDIDVFIYGDLDQLKTVSWWEGLSREIQVHIFKSKEEIRSIRSGIMNNIVKGYFVKGSIHDLAEVSI